jgi:hypothetical protein
MFKWLFNKEQQSDDFIIIETKKVDKDYDCRFFTDHELYERNENGYADKIEESNVEIIEEVKEESTESPNESPNEEIKEELIESPIEEEVKEESIKEIIESPIEEEVKEESNEEIIECQCSNEKEKEKANNESPKPMLLKTQLDSRIDPVIFAPGPPFEIVEDELEKICRKIIEFLFTTNVMMEEFIKDRF